VWSSGSRRQIKKPLTFRPTFSPRTVRFKRRFLEDIAKSCLERWGLSLKEIVRATRFDLNRAEYAWLVKGLGPCLAGNANGEMLLYIRAGKGWRKILDDVGQSLEVCAQAHLPCHVPRGSERRSASTHGWPDLSLYRHGSASEGDQFVYRFDGNAYKAVACNVVGDLARVVVANRPPIVGDLARLSRIAR